MADQEAKPFHLRGNFAPVTDEIEVFDLEVEGALPPELNGVFVRNGANPKSGTSPHWFLGDGMLHGLRLSKGQAKWYRNRYVRGGRFLHPDEPTVNMSTGVRRYDLSTANTHVVRHAGRLFALEEGSFPVEVTPDLETIGAFDFGGKLPRAFTAHPKICPHTGEMLAFGYDFMPPYLTYYRIDTNGQLVQLEEIPVAGPTMIHDFGITRTKAIFFDLPVVFDLELALKSKMPFRWDETYPARIGIMPRTGSAQDLVWYDVDPCFIFHPSNAYDDGSDVVLEACRYPSMWRQSAWGAETANLWRYRFSPGASKAAETQLDELGTEFPRIDDALAGSKHRFSYMPHTSGGDLIREAWGSAVVKADAETGRSELIEFGQGRHPGEVVFARAEGGSSEDDGYLMTYVFDEAENTSVFEVRDAQAPKAPAVAKVRLPQRVPFGFHGNWFAD